MSKDDKILRAFSERFLKILDEENLGSVPDAVLAKRFHASNTAVWYWKNGRKMPSITTAIRLAIDLNVCVEYLLTGRGPMRPENHCQPADQLDLSALPVEAKDYIKKAFHAIADQISVYKKSIGP